jgi:alkylation response protein AidB-like acyl-CoA dehydrogenase
MLGAATIQRVGVAMDFAHSSIAARTIQEVREFLVERIEPAEARYEAELAGGGDWTSWRQPPTMERLKAEARDAGLWNLFFPDPTHGAGHTNVEYAPVAEITGRSFIAAEVFNCNAPDTGNMEVLAMYGSVDQQRAWLAPLMTGEIRSAFCMTEPDVASSDATNMRATAIVEGDEVVINGRKWWSTGIGHPNCRLIIFMGLTDPDADPHRRHSMVVVPIDSPGVRIERMLSMFGAFDEPFGHGEVTFTDVRVPVSNIIAGPGRGFEIAQGRLGPGRIHHCMRMIGMAERALELMCRRAAERTAFGKPLARLGGNADVIANSRIAIDQARLLTLRAAWMMDRVGVKGAMSEISQIKVVAPAVAQQVVDAAIQMHGGLGMSDEIPLTRMHAWARALRIADGPDEVHRALIAKLELRRQESGNTAPRH